ncbi:hypothetical protein ACHAW6_011282 [Cyclotella cf. meneghiniana]
MDSPAFLPGATSSNLRSSSAMDISLHVPCHATNEPSNSINSRNGDLEQPRRFKRSHCDKHNVVSGRSLKRLRLDHTLVTLTTANNGSHSRNSLNNHPFDAQSIGTLSVGTMGGDMESNDEDTGNYDEEDEEEEEAVESASQSSWVASLHSLASRRRMPCCHGQDAKTASHAAVEPPCDDGDDAATCSEMTTAAVAPRRTGRHRARRREMRINGDASSLLLNGDRKRRAIGFTIDTFNGAMAGEFTGLKDHDLVVEEIDLDSMLVDHGQPSTDAPNQSFSYAPSSTEPQRAMLASPPVECIPDPLLVAAQHAAGGGAFHHTDQNIDTGHGSATESAKGLLFLGDCYSSVTEEETSLAEDEASLSAISVGGNTTTSIGGMTMASSRGGIIRCHGGGSEVLVGVQKPGSKEILHSTKDAGLIAAPPPPASFGEHNVNNAMQQQGKSCDYNSLNHFLGSLHQERQHRKSAVTSPHRREASFHSLGSMGVNSNVSGNSHRSCPNYFMNYASAPSSWRGQTFEHSVAPMMMMVNGGKGPTTGLLPSPGDMDVDTEGPSSTHPTTCSNASVASMYGSQTTGSANASQAGSEGKQSTDSGVPKWKRRVKLPSHSSLY